jgi:hypothetical protein
MIIIRLQLAVYNSGNVQVKRREDFSRLGGIPVFVKGGAPKNNTDTSHGISVFSYGENPTEFLCMVCLVPLNVDTNRTILFKTIF